MMDMIHYEGTEDRDDGTARELLGFTIERLPHYKWLTWKLVTNDPNQDTTTKDRT